MSERHQVSDEDLSDLIDGRLDPATRAAVGAAMDRDPTLARRYATLLEQDRLLRHLGEEVLGEAIPERLTEILDRVREEREDEEVDRSATQQLRFSPWRRMPQIAMLLAGTAAGVAGGWFGHAEFGGGQAGLFRAAVEQAAISHRLFEVGDENRIGDLGDGEVLPAASLPDLFETPIRAPALRGSRWVPVGLRTEDGSGGKAMQIAYADQEGKKVTLSVRTIEGTDDLPSSLVEAEGYNVLYWLDGPMLYALVGDIDETELSRLARDVYVSRAVGGRWPSDPIPAAADEPDAN